MEQYARAVVAGEIVAGRFVRLACERHLRDIVEGPARGLKWDREAAEHAISFFSFLRLPAHGELDGKPFDLEPFQKFIVGSIFGWKGADGTRRFRTAYCEIGKGNGKALAVDTPIPTPAGWATMGDLQPGDTVFDENGDICNVLATSKIMSGRPCYRVVFSDGQEIIADADHLWRVAMLRSHGKKGPKPADAPRKGGYAVLTTAQIAATYRIPPSSSVHPQARWNYRVDCASPLQLSEKRLEVDPYVLGCWLGDGDSDCARLTCADDEIVGNLQAVGCEVISGRSQTGTKAKRYRIGSRRNAIICRRGHPKLIEWSRGKCRACDRETDYARRHGLPVPPNGAPSLNEWLRKAGLFHNKHIPRVYLRSSEQQRMSLLQGLMDTDGYASKEGQVEFTSVNSRLAADVMELARSLGYKPTMGVDRATLHGRDCGPKYRIRFGAWSDRSPFRLSRKSNRLRHRPPTRPIAAGRMIVGCEPVDSVPVKCIAVNSLSRLYLAGRGMIPTHNSPLAGGIGLYGLTADDEASAEVYSAATTREQAGILFRDAKMMVEASPALRKLLGPGALGIGNIAYVAKASFFRPVSSEHRGLDGKRPHMALIDEVHEHPTPLVVDKMRAGTKGRRQALIFEITNSGADRTTVCWNHREYSVKILEGILENDSWFAYVCALDPCEKCRGEGHTQPVDGCKDCDDWTDEACWPKANPGMGTILPIKYLREQVAEAKGIPAKEGIVQRLNFCIWTAGAVKAIPMDRWDGCKQTFDMEWFKGRGCWGGLDIGATSDFTAYVLTFPHDDSEVIELPAQEGQENAPPRTLVRSTCSILPFFWLPERPVRRDQRMTELIDYWRRQGWVRTTPGEVVDYNVVLQDIKELSEKYDLREIGIDRGFQGGWMATALMAHFGESFVVSMPAGIISMSQPFREMIELIVAGRYHHDGNPVLRWMASNCASEQRGGLIKPSKDQSSEKIDGITAGCLSLARAMQRQGESSNWIQPGMFKD